MGLPRLGKMRKARLFPFMGQFCAHSPLLTAATPPSAPNYITRDTDCRGLRRVTVPGEGAQSRALTGATKWPVAAQGLGEHLARGPLRDPGVTQDMKATSPS